MTKPAFALAAARANHASPADINKVLRMIDPRLYLCLGAHPGRRPRLPHGKPFASAKRYVKPCPVIGKIVCRATVDFRSDSARSAAPGGGKR